MIRRTRKNLFSGNWVNIIINKTEASFVIPRNCFYGKKSTIPEKLHYILPITPKVAIILMPSEEIKEYETENGTRDYLYIDDENTVRAMNELALNIELVTNNRFIVGQRSELKRIRKIYSKRMRKKRIQALKRILQTKISIIFNIFHNLFKKKIL